jgi:predicted helicase
MMNLPEPIVWKYVIHHFSNETRGIVWNGLMLSFFNAYLLYKKEFGNTWLWNEFPLTRDFDASKKNLGTDLTAYTKRVDCLAFQYKCYKKYTSDKLNVDNFLSILNRFFDDILKTGEKQISPTAWIETSQKGLSQEAWIAVQNHTMRWK